MMMGAWLRSLTIYIYRYIDYVTGFWPNCSLEASYKIIDFKALYTRTVASGYIFYFLFMFIIHTEQSALLVCSRKKKRNHTLLTITVL